MLRRMSKKLNWGMLLAALLPLVAILPTLNGSQVINTADGVFHVHRIFAMTTLMQSGDLYPRWIPYFHLGYGYPVFNFYAPLATWLGGLLGLVGISAALAFSLIVAAGWMLGSAGVYALGRRWLPAPAALVGAALWSYAPSAFQGVWNIGSLSQLTASALVPWLFLAVIRAAEKPDTRRVSVLGAVFALLLLAHQPTSVLVGLFIAPGAPLLCLWFARGDKRWLARFASVGGGLVLGAGIAMIFLLPMALEVGFIQVSKGATNLANVLAASFLQPYQLFLPSAAPDLSDLSRSIPDSIGLISGVLAVLGLIGLVYRRQYRLALAWGVSAVFVIFLLLPVSIEFWLNVPLLGQLRFPGRVLRLGAVFFGLLGASSLLLLPGRWMGWGAGLVSALIMISSLPMAYPSRELLDFNRLSAADFIRYEQDTYSFGGTSYDEFKPIWGDKIPYDMPPDLASYVSDPLHLSLKLDGQVNVRVSLVDDTHFQITTPQPFELHVRQFYFPGWTATIDGKPTDVFPDAEFGLLSLNVPAGVHLIALARTGTAVEQIAPWLSLVNVIIATTLFVFRRDGFRASVRPNPIPETPSLPPPQAREGTEKSLPTVTVVAVMVIGFAIFNRFYIQPQTDWFRIRSPLDNPAGMQTPVHVVFGDAYELLGYTLNQNTVAPTETLNVTLYWRALRPLEGSYPPTVQLVNPAVSEAWGTVSNFFIGAASVNHQPDYFISDTYKLPVNADAPPYIGHISIQLKNGETHESLRLPDGSDRLILPATVRVTGNGVKASQQLNVTIANSVELWCASTSTADNQLQLTLYWHVLNPLPQSDLRVFVHGLDANGQFVSQGDAPPLNGQYAPSDWLAGQTLVDHYQLADADKISQIAVGMFTLNGDQLPMTHDGQPALDNSLILSPQTVDCESK
ncbi:MAG: hypothetical protein GC179_29145 [Anaerolineaceae bacterium]|nr:hypothetical protein [Anaerolineaceae bacterium]